MNIVIYHNPACGTSRNVLKIIQDAGYAPTVIEYVEEGWTRSQLLDLLPVWPAGPYHKEDGELMIDAQGNRV